MTSRQVVVLGGVTFLLVILIILNPLKIIPTLDDNIVRVFTFIVALANLVWLILFSVYRLAFDKHELRQRIFFVENILLPICVSPLRDFITTTIEELKLTETACRLLDANEIIGSYTEYNRDSKAKSEDLKNKFRLFKTIDDALEQKLYKHLENIEDVITKHCRLKSTPAIQPGEDEKELMQCSVVTGRLMIEFASLMRQIMDIDLYKGNRTA